MIILYIGSVVPRIWIARLPAYFHPETVNYLPSSGPSYRTFHKHPATCLSTNNNTSIIPIRWSIHPFIHSFITILIYNGEGRNLPFNECFDGINDACFQCNGDDIVDGSQVQFFNGLSKDPQVFELHRKQKGYYEEGGRRSILMIVMILLTLTAMKLRIRYGVITDTIISPPSTSSSISNKRWILWSTSILAAL
jgi:hypothetical protein